uniref:RRM domain-containing protein n=1 Tax=Rhizochromulina marina TaxID=1034831 RepID=A0A7S2SV17_9STRA|mmetsp:Transcript_8930/g.25546  ORF Transcript_8930/g.25546 Transcript_8930/m.25546 type:complete len:266 (+) Transcript_8930:36-833(+)|eukprot:CAMPEP_0118961712 /NCGR_PEP_ID=MMETSP1173-20130426/305_1 /TAXON_ID=1034831 /ORGANISM="Rhizochromulina marina cf, Strain CCMP1243" /LENGTH=265 /DNA_ID=CAMNT_0006909897 /DNA_START=34 /DNA_END=831 /DNA_ORIENTATION=+
MASRVLWLAVVALLLETSSAFVFPSRGQFVSKTLGSSVRAPAVVLRADEEDTSEAASDVEELDLSPVSDAAPAFTAGGGDDVEARKVFVGNLNFDVADEELYQFFAQAGEVEEATHVSDRMSGRRRGFGFITFATVEGANAAVDQFNGVDLAGRSIRVDAAGNKPTAPPKQERRNNNRYDDANRRVFVGNLDFGTTEETLEQIFSDFGEVERCVHVSEVDDPFRKRGFGFITFSNSADAEAAVESLDGLEVDGRSLRISMANSRR